MCPHSPSGLRRRMLNFIASTITAKATMLINTVIAQGRQKALPNQAISANPAHQNQESPEWARKIHTVRNKPGRSATRMRAESRASSSRIDLSFTSSLSWLLYEGVS